MSGREVLGELEQLSMLAVLRLGADAYGAAVRQELDRIARRPVSIATVYVTLTRLEKKGHVQSRRSAPSPVRGGKARRHFAVTPKGMSVLRASRDAFERMWDGVTGRPDPGGVSS